MKRYLILFFCVAVAVSCGRKGKDTQAGKADAPTAAQTTEQHIHADGSECTGSHDEHGHDASHVHEDGAECAGDHGAGTDGHDGHDHAAGGCSDGHDHGAENPDEIIFTAEQAAKTDFKVEEAATSTFTEVIKASGRIMPAQGQEVTLAAPVSGIVSFAGARLSEGNAVGKQNLFHISTKSIGGGDVAAKAKAEYERAGAEYERAQKLLADKIVSQREFEAITAEYLRAKAEYEGLAGSQSEKGTGVASPIAGYIMTLSVNEGDFVEMGQTLATVSQNRRLTLRAEVSQRYYSRLGSVTGANFTVPYSDATYRLADMGGRLISVGQSSAANTPLIPVTFEFDNNGTVVPGSYVEVYLLGAPVANAVTLPVTAITEQQGLYHVYVQLDRDGYERREVRLGAGDGERVRILSGICPGERVVTRGAINVKLAGASGAIPHSHEH